MKKLIGILFCLAVLMLPSRADAVTAYCASMTNCTGSFNATEVVAFGAGPYGTINLVLSGSVIDVTIDLAGDQATGFHMIENGSHIAFGLNVNNDTALGVVGQVTLSNITSGYTQNANNGSIPSVSPPAQGTYNISLTTGCSNGGGCGQNVVTFTASRVGGFNDVNQLINLNSDGRFATADVALITPSTTDDNPTGPIHVTGTAGPGTFTTNSVPEPSSVALLGIGLAALGFVRRLRQ